MFVPEELERGCSALSRAQAAEGKSEAPLAERTVCRKGCGDGLHPARQQNEAQIVTAHIAWNL